jgi:hypothetical protein
LSLGYERWSKEKKSSDRRLGLVSCVVSAFDVLPESDGFSSSLSSLSSLN